MILDGKDKYLYNHTCCIVSIKEYVCHYDPTKKLMPDREWYIIGGLFVYDWGDMVKEKDTFEITQKYTAKNNIFMQENWKK